MTRRLGRILVPYATWSLLLCILPALLRHEEGTAADVGKRVLFGWTFTGGYFLLALAQLTLLAPLLLRLIGSGGRAGPLLCSAAFLATEALYAAAAYGDGPLSRHVREVFSASLTIGAVWGHFFIAGLWAARERRRLLPWLARRGAVIAAAGAALYAASLWELRFVFDRTGSLGLAAGFHKPTSALFALAVCAFVLSRGEGAPAAGFLAPVAHRAPIAPAWSVLASGSYAIYLMHGSVVLALLSAGAPWWRGIIEGPAGPLALGACAIALPLAAYRLAERHAPGWARYALFG